MPYIPPRHSLAYRPSLPCRESISAVRNTQRLPQDVPKWTHQQLNGNIPSQKPAEGNIYPNVRNKTIPAKPLPAELILQITSYLHPVKDQSTLHQMTLVSRMFAACANPILWQTITLKSYIDLHKIINQQLTSNPSLMIRKTRALRVTSVRMSAIFDDMHLKTIVRIIPNLETLEFMCANKLTDDGVDHAIRILGSQLKIIRFDRCQALTNESLNSIARHCPNLRVFSMSYNYNITDAAIVKLVHQCPLLTYVNLECTAKIGEDSAIALATSSRHLKYLDLKLVHIGERALAALAAGVSSLDHSSEDQGNKTNNITTHSTLEFIAISKCTTDFSTSSLSKALVRHASSLRGISIMLDNHLTPDLLRNIMIQCPLITNVKIHRCAQLDDEVINAETHRGWPNRHVQVIEANHISMEDIDVSRYVL